MADATYTVVKGDTLSEIASNYYSTYGTSYSSSTAYMNYLVSLNNIANANLIYVGQVIKLTGTATAVETNTTKSTVTITHFGLLADTDDTIYVAWSWDKSNTEEYEVRWYRSWDQLGIAPFEDSTVTHPLKYHTYTAPSEVVNSEYGKVSVSIRPISKTKKDSDGNETTYWTASWSSITDDTRYYFKNNPPTDTPSAPDVTIEDYTLTATVENVPDNVTQVQFQVVQDNSSSTYKSGKATVSSNYASCSWTVVAGSEYKVRCRYINDNGNSEWSDWSSNSGTQPSASSGITVCKASSETSVYLEWGTVSNATSYDLEYTTDKNYFDGSDQTSTVSGITSTQYTKTGLESGQEYYFRVRAVNEYGESAWSAAKSVILGTEPAAPTTWSSTTTVITGETLTLYWVHNSEDGSAQDSAQIELTIDGTTSTKTLDTSSEDEDERTMYYSIDTSGYTEGVTILWRVRTAGVTGDYGDWSVQRTVNVYAPPTISINITDSTATEISTLLSFPFYIGGSAGPSTQTPVGYHLTVVSNSYYETVDNVGIRKIVNEGDEVYSKYIDSSSYSLLVQLSADNIDLENNVTYTVKCVLSMDSGLTGEDSRDFTVAWTDERYEPNAEISINTDDITAAISPYCKDEEENLIDGIILSVYRREFDGGFTELATGLKNTNATFITDPHPALDYARYRIVAISESTGAVSYCDLAGIQVGEKAIVIQWDEAWSNYENSDYLTGEVPWAGSMLKLPYNIDVSDEHTPDVSLIEYIGRSYPVSYYGTQLGHTSSWSVEIPKTDVETLYAIRRLSIWRGDVYVREPSGTGYWANITVSYSQKHLDTIIPVKFSITRVAGGT